MEKERKFVGIRIDSNLNSIINKCLAANLYCSNISELVRYAIVFYAVATKTISLEDVPKDIKGRVNLTIDGLNFGGSMNKTDSEFEKILLRLGKITKNTEILLGVINNIMFFTPEALSNNPPSDTYQSHKTSPHNFLKAAETEYNKLTEYKRIDQANKNGV